MICPKCHSFKSAYHTYCEDDGSLMVKFNCECGNALSYRQKFCEKCGKAAPEFEAEAKEYMNPYTVASNGVPTKPRIVEVIPEGASRVEAEHDSDPA